MPNVFQVQSIVLKSHLSNLFACCEVTESSEFLVGTELRFTENQGPAELW